jgi:hypothetical protein
MWLILNLGWVLKGSARYLLGILLACRTLAVLAPAGPVPVGGFRIPFSRSLRTTALFRSAFREANSKVNRFRPWASR